MFDAFVCSYAPSTRSCDKGQQQKATAKGKNKKQQQKV